MFESQKIRSNYIIRSYKKETECSWKYDIIELCFQQSILNNNFDLKENYIDRSDKSKKILFRFPNTKNDNDNCTIFNKNNFILYLKMFIVPPINSFNHQVFIMSGASHACQIVKLMATKIIYK